MKLHSKKMNIKKKAFSLVEVLASMTILALISSSVWIVIDRSVTSMADLEMQMNAFEIARENMEILLSKSSVSETTEYGSSDKFPDIQWKTVVETFYEPIESQVWLRGTCTAEYFDSSGEKQTIELSHWLTGLTEAQLLQLSMQDEAELEMLEDQFIETVEDAAEYAGVDPETIEQWLEDGLEITEEGFFIKSELDYFKSNNEIQETEKITENDRSDETEQDEDDLPIESDSTYDELE